MLKVEQRTMPAVGPDKKSEFEADYRNNELAFVNGDIGYRKMLEFLKNSRNISAGEPESIDAKIKLFEAMSVHYDANLKFGSFHGNLEKHARENKGMPAISLSREEVTEQFEKYRDKDQLIEWEDRAMAGYIEALNKWEGGPYIDPEEVEEMLLDLQYRQAQRISNGQTRIDKLDGLREGYIALIKKIRSPGKRSETIMNLLAKEWSRSKFGHVLDCAHGQPQEDKGWGIDLVMSAGIRQNVGLKSYSDDSYVQGFNEGLRKKEKQKLAGSNVMLLDPGHEKITAAYEEWIYKNRRGKMNNLIGPIIKKVFGDVPEAEGKKSADEKSAFFKAYGDIPGLKMLEILKEEDLAGLDPSKVESINAVIQAKKAELRKAMNDPEEFQKLKDKARIYEERAE